MDDKQIVEGNIGNVGKYDVEFKGGHLVASVGANMAVGEVAVELKIGAKQVLDAIAKAIPGQIDDKVIELLEKALGLSA